MQQRSEVVRSRAGPLSDRLHPGVSYRSVFIGPGVRTFACKGRGHPKSGQIPTSLLRRTSGGSGSSRTARSSLRPYASTLAYGVKRHSSCATRRQRKGACGPGSLLGGPQGATSPPGSHSSARGRPVKRRRGGQTCRPVSIQRIRKTGDVDEQQHADAATHHVAAEHREHHPRPRDLPCSEDSPHREREEGEQYEVAEQVQHGSLRGTFGDRCRRSTSCSSCGDVALRGGPQAVEGVQDEVESDRELVTRFVGGLEERDRDLVEVGVGVRGHLRDEDVVSDLGHSSAVSKGRLAS